MMKYNALENLHNKSFTEDYSDINQVINFLILVIIYSKFIL